MLRVIGCLVCNKSTSHYSVTIQGEGTLSESWHCQVCHTENDVSPNLLEPRRGPIRPVRQASPQIATHDYQEGTHDANE